MFRATIALLCTAALLAIPAVSFSQSFEWAEGHGSNSIYGEGGASIVVDGSGNLIVTGGFWGTANFGGSDFTSSGYGLDIFLAKYDANGVHQWSKSFGSTDYDQGYSVAVDASGAVFMTGRFHGTVNFGGGDLVSSGYDGFLVKFDANGVHQWSKRFGGTVDNDDGESVAVDGSGNVILTGFFGQSVDFGGGPLTTAGNTDIFIAKFDGNGALLWNKRIGSSNFDDGYAVAVDGSNNVIITGTFGGTVDFGGGGLTVAGGSDIFLAKYDAGGAHQWSQRFGGTGNDNPGSVAVDGSGAVILTGDFANTANFGGGDLVSAGNTDLFVAKYDAAGAHQWSERFGGPAADYGSGVAADAAGNVVVTGFFQGIATGPSSGLVSYGGLDIVIASYNSGGVRQWIQGLGGAGSDGGASIAMAGSGDAVLTGNFSNTVHMGSSTLVSSGERDVFIARLALAPVTGVSGTPGRNALSISAYPNPFNPATTIRYAVPSRGRVNVAIYDVRGSRVATLVDEEKPAGAFTQAWNGRNDAGRPVSSGVYFARVTHALGSRSSKVVLEK